MPNLDQHCRLNMKFSPNPAVSDRVELSKIKSQSTLNALLLTVSADIAQTITTSARLVTLTPIPSVILMI